MKAASKTAATTPESPKFEAALASLEEIVAEMENGELPLDRLIERYEEGIRLVKLCDEKLAEAEQKIEVLTSGKAPAKPSAAPAPEEGGPSLF